MLLYKKILNFLPLSENTANTKGNDTCGALWTPPCGARRALLKHLDLPCGVLLRILVFPGGHFLLLFRSKNHVFLLQQLPALELNLCGIYMLLGLLLLGSLIFVCFFLVVFA